MIRLSPEKISEELKNLPGWSIKDEKLHRDFEFESFNQAFGFMTRAAIEIEKMKELMTEAKFDTKYREVIEERFREQYQYLRKSGNDSFQLCG